MIKLQEIASAELAAGRLFRAYGRHCDEPNTDTFFDVLTALHSLNDRLKRATDRDLHEMEEFVALKVLRNFAHHQDEVHSNVRVIPTQAQSDLRFMCIVRRDQVDLAIANVDKKWRDASRQACEARFHWYGPAVNVNPALFNLVVRAYELLQVVGISPPKDDVAFLRESYEFETQHGYSHYIDGRLTVNAAEADEIFAQVVIDLPGI